MAAMSEKYRLYHLHLFVEVMTEEIGELMRYGVSPLGVGYVEPLKKDLQKKIRPILMKIADCVKDAAEKKIEDGVAAPDEPFTSEEWVRTMFEELRTRVSALDDAYGQDINPVMALIHQMEDILAGKDRIDEEQ
jgi:hypothetical protein